MRINRIRFILELAKKDLTLKVLAEKSGVSRQTLSYIKSGKNCTELVACKIAKALDVDVTELIED
ncbi:helix-turn-helix domain-containing protein [Anaerosporobacter sp.]